jgi:hypothetical protein
MYSKLGTRIQSALPTHVLLNGRHEVCATWSSEVFEMLPEVAFDPCALEYSTNHIVQR